MRKDRRKIITISSIVLLIVICLSLVACRNSKLPTGENTVDISLAGVSGLRKITMTVENTETHKEYELDFLRKANYTNSFSMDFGIYKIIEIDSNDIDYKVEVSPDAGSITNAFDISNNTFIVAENSDITITVNVEDITGSLSWFLKNNAFALTGIIVCLIGLFIIKLKKKYRIVTVSTEDQFISKENKLSLDKNINETIIEENAMLDADNTEINREK